MAAGPPYPSKGRVGPPRYTYTPGGSFFSLGPPFSAGGGSRGNNKISVLGISNRWGSTPRWGPLMAPAGGRARKNGICTGQCATGAARRLAVAVACCCLQDRDLDQGLCEQAAGGLVLVLGLSEVEAGGGDVDPVRQEACHTLPGLQRRALRAADGEVSAEPRGGRFRRKRPDAGANDLGAFSGGRLAGGLREPAVGTGAEER